MSTSTVPSVGRLLAHAWLTVLCGFALLVLVAVALAKPLGYRVLVDRSDSMAPAIRAGDVLVTEVIPPRKAKVGDVVTFDSPDRGGRLLTHRVVSRRLWPDGRWTFVTRGDANTGSERWDVSAEGRIGELRLRVPRAGYAVAWLRNPIAHVLLVGLGGLALAVLLARRIWSL